MVNDPMCKQQFLQSVMSLRLKICRALVQQTFENFQPNFKLVHQFKLFLNHHNWCLNDHYQYDYLPFWQSKKFA